ncbi:MAG: SusC/RagA family TonB-linked outer membrane protein, partial [Candidatus Cryptobacteroides sp.]
MYTKTILNRLFQRALMTALLGCVSTCFNVYADSVFLQEDNISEGQHTRKVSGRVISGGDGQPLIGVSVFSQKTGKGVITDMDGTYSIDASEGEVLKFSYVGYKDLLETVTDSDNLDVLMEENSTLLTETVVVGFASQKKVNLTGAVGVVGKDEINGRPVSSLAQALQGLDPSMNIGVNSGRADSGYTIDIRGTASLNGGSPLILVDGVEMALNRVNPNDIESVSILKDAAAAAVYGAKASAGVVLVTTKNGNEGKVNISYNGRFAMMNNTTSTDYITNGYEWGKVVDTFFLYSNKAKPYLKYDDEDWKQIEMRRNDKTENPDRPWVVAGADGNYRYYGNFDWYNYFFKKLRLSHEHNITVTGGNDNVKYYLSARAYDTQGMMKIQNDPYASYNVRGKVDVKLAKWARLHTNVNYFYSKMKWPGLKNYQKTFYYVTFGGSPLFSPTNPDGTIVENIAVLNQSANLCGGMNLMLTYNKAKNLETVNETTIKNDLEFDLAKGLTLHLSHAYSYTNEFGQYRSTNAPYSSKEGVISWMTVKNFLNNLEESSKSQYKHTAEAYADYAHTWNEAHNFKVVAGMQYDTRYYRKHSMTVDGSLSEDLSDFNLVSASMYSVSGGQSKYQTLGVFGRINYDYKGKYLFELSGRADGSSRFWKQNRWGFFPSGSVGWRISEEEFWTPLRGWWNNAKIRFSVGSLGNQQVSDYLFVQKINAHKESSELTCNGSDKLLYAQEDDPVSSDLTWETVTTYDIGADLYFLDNRLSFTGDYYIRDTKNMMMPGASLPGVYGAVEPRTNAADMRTKGWEVSLAWKDVVNMAGRPLAYGVRGSIGDYHTDVTRFDNDTRLISDHYVGERLGDIWGFSVGGLFSTDEEAAEYAGQVDCSYFTKQINATSTRKGLHAGDVKYLDSNGDGKLSIGKNTVDEPGDMKVIGNSLPRYSSLIPQSGLLKNSKPLIK